MERALATVRQVTHKGVLPWERAMGPPPAAQGPTHRTNPRAIQPGWLSTETAAANRQADWPSGHRDAFEQRGPRSEHADPKMQWAQNGRFWASDYASLLRHKDEWRGTARSGHADAPRLPANAPRRNEKPRPLSHSAEAKLHGLARGYSIRTLRRVKRKIPASWETGSRLLTESQSARLRDWARGW